MKNSGRFSNVDEYIALQPPGIREGLELIRKTIKKAAPKAEETISYQMPAYKLKGALVFFGATSTHLGFYPTASPMEAFREKLQNFDVSKGTIRFPLGKPIPVKLIADIVKWRVAENLARDIAKTEANKKQKTTDRLSR